MSYTIGIGKKLEVTIIKTFAYRIITLEAGIT